MLLFLSLSLSPLSTPVMQMLLLLSLYRWGNWRTQLANGRTRLDHKYLPPHTSVYFFSVGTVAVYLCLKTDTQTERDRGHWPTTSPRRAPLKGILSKHRERSLRLTIRTWQQFNIPLILVPQKTETSSS